MQQYLIPRKAALICAACFLVAIIVNATGMVRVETVTGAIPSLCPFKIITGIECPGCGMTRAMVSLVKGHPGDAASHNPFCFFLVFLLLLSILPSRLLERSRTRLGRVLPVFYSGILVLVLIFWVFDRLLPSVFG